MGAADLVPGISGGTIAFILGFYRPLLESLQTINIKAFSLLLRGNWGAFSQQVAWRFLATLFAGITTAVIVLANAFHFILGHDVYRIYLYASFLGLVLASFIFCVRQVKKWGRSTAICLVLGSFSAYLLTTTTGPSLAVDAREASQDFSFFSGWIFLSGAIAVCALLLPGISGSYILTLLGVYPTVIDALAQFIRGVAKFSFNGEAFSILSSLAFGIVVGALAFTRFLNWVLNRFPNQSLALLSGFMIGAIRSVWPFWSEHLAVQHPYFPSWSTPHAWQAFLCASGAFLFVIAAEVYSKKKKTYRFQQPKNEGA